MSDFQFFDFLVVGNFQTEYIINLQNHSHPDLLGGSALYSAGGIRCWNDRIAVMGHTHSKHKPQIARFHDTYQIDFKGVQFHDDFPDDRVFLGCTSLQETIKENPVAYYASRKLPFPKALIEYPKNSAAGHSPGKSKFLPEDMPKSYQGTTSSLICSFDIITQLQLSSILINASTNTLIIQSSPSYMNMQNFETMPALMKDLTTFVTSSQQLKELFINRTTDLWEMAEYLGSLGCEIIVITDENSGFFLYESGGKQRYQTPIYPVGITDPIGLLDSFCGGFLAGMKTSFNPIEALIHGAVSASFTGEGSGPFFGLQALTGLHQSRLEFAREFIKKI